MANCPECKAELLDTSRFCHLCGRAIMKSGGGSIQTLTAEAIAIAQEKMLREKLRSSPGLAKLKKRFSAEWTDAKGGIPGIIEQLRKSDVRISASSMFPDLNQHIRDAFSLFGQGSRSFEAFIGQDPDMGQENAFSTFDGDTPVFEFVNKILPLMSPIELRAVVGHEVGHVILGHPLDFDGAIVRNIRANLQLVEDSTRGILDDRDIQYTFALSGALSWYQELNADRFALILTRDLAATLSAFVKLALGFSPPAPVEVETFLREFVPATIEDLMVSHPDYPKRSRALEIFSQSDVYQAFVGGTGGRPLAELEPEFAAIVPDISNLEPSKRMEAIDLWVTEFFLMAAIAAADGRITRKEEELIWRLVPPSLHKHFDELWDYAENTLNHRKKYKEVTTQAARQPSAWKTKMLKRMIRVAKADRRIERKELSDICALAMDMDAKEQCERVFLNELGITIKWPARK